MKKLIAVLYLSLTVLVAMAPFIAQAETKSLWPDQFTLSAFDQSMADAETKAMRDFSRLGAIRGCAIYESEVRLPAGRRITRFAVNASLSNADNIVADLFYESLGGPGPELAAYLELSGEHNQAWYEPPYIWQPHVRAGCRYWVFLNICGSASVKGVRVSYR